ncbi:MAG: metallophosphoesterase [Bacteroidota bacterium]
MKRTYLLLLCLFIVAFLKAQQNEEGFLVKPYLQFATQNSIVILWETKDSASTTVEFGKAVLNAKEAVLERTTSIGGVRKMHEVDLNLLEPETNYFWRVRSTTKSGMEIVSPTYSFKTAVKDSSAIFFALVGDSQRNNGTPWAWDSIATLVWKDRPHFVLHAGDLVDVGSRKTDWTEHFFPDGHDMMSRFPMYTVLGNHEQDDDLYYQYMANPAPEYYYSFKYGNAEFFMIDTNKDVKENSEQYNWLEWALAKSKASWKIVVHHHPPYSSEADDHGDTYKAASTMGTDSRNLVPLYERYGVDFCLFGHTHVYERSWPLRGDRISEKDGVIYINSGGAGGFLEDFAPTRNWFTLEVQTGHHYCTFAIYDKTLVFKAIDHESRVFDSFQMTKQESNKGSAALIQPPAPHIQTANTVFQEKTKVSMEAAFEDLEIRYTLDGSDPLSSSTLYKEEFELSQSANIKARAFSKEGKASRMVDMTFKQMDPQLAQKVKKTQSGLSYKYYEGDWERLPDFKDLKVLKSGMSKQISLSEIEHRENHFGLVLEGYVDFPSTGMYELFIRSDDGSKLYLNDELLIDHDGNHAALKKTAKTILAKGKHKIRIEYFESGGGQMLNAGIVDKELGVVPFTPFQLSH